MSDKSDNNLFFLDDLTVVRLAYNHVVNALALVNTLESGVNNGSILLSDIRENLVSSQASLFGAITLLED